MEEERKLVSIVFTDIKGYTAMMENDEAVALSTVERFEKFTKETCDKYRGKIINFMGDGALLIFENSTDAVAFAVDIQTRFIVEENIQHRIGINTGEVVLKDGNVYGDSVNVAARIESLGVPGVVLISDSTCKLIKNKKQFAVKSMGKFHFKNKKDLMEIFAVTNEPLTIPQRKDLKGKTETKKLHKGWFIAAFTIIIALLVGVFQYNKYISTSQEKTWEGNWDIKVPDQDNNLMDGELKLNKDKDGWIGIATVPYNKAQDVSTEITLMDIVENPELNSLSGSWKANIPVPDTLRGSFELKMEPSFKKFEGNFTLLNGGSNFRWQGNRK